MGLCKATVHGLRVFARQVVDSKTQSIDLSNSLTSVNPEELVDMVNFQKKDHWPVSIFFSAFVKNQP